MEPIDDFGVPDRTIKDFGIQRFVMEPIKDIGIQRFWIEPIKDIGIRRFQIEPIKDIGIRRFRMEPIKDFGIQRFQIEPIKDIGIRRFWIEPIKDFGIQRSSELLIPDSGVNEFSFSLGPSVPDFGDNCFFSSWTLEITGGVLRFLDFEDDGYQRPLLWIGIDWHQLGHLDRYQLRPLETCGIGCDL
ncbi:adhesive plaque matrix protein-like [Rhizophagus irregularis DAOM 181602=DAOM 197198]|nr:adhesive plaque matrix protein-like [Rhizophagus irregularis DAOM 181602=DAOM 197198]